MSISSGEYLKQLTVIVGKWPYNTYFRLKQGCVGQHNIRLNLEHPCSAGSWRTFPSCFLSALPNQGILIEPGRSIRGWNLQSPSLWWPKLVSTLSCLVRSPVLGTTEFLGEPSGWLSILTPDGPSVGLLRCRRRGLMTSKDSSQVLTHEIYWYLTS